MVLKTSSHKEVTIIIAFTLACKIFWLSLKYWFGWLMPASHDEPWTASKVNVHANCTNSPHCSQTKVMWNKLDSSKSKFLRWLIMYDLIVPILYFIHYIFYCTTTYSHSTNCSPQVFLTIANNGSHRKNHTCKIQSP